MSVKIISGVLRIKASLAIVLIVLGAFLLLSENFYIPMETMSSLSFGITQPQNILFYELIHIGPYHLLSNLAALLVFAIVVELSLSSKDLLAIFFSSVVLTAIFFALLNPLALVIGASGGILSLVTASFFSSPKKAIAAGIIAIAFGAILFVGLNSAVLFTEQGFETKTAEIESGIQQAVEEKDVPRQRQLEKQLGETTEEKKVFEQAQRVEKYSVSDYASHVFASLLGIAYVFFLRKKKFTASIEQMYNFLHGLKLRFQ